jgi:hypothetical protein
MAAYVRRLGLGPAAGGPVIAGCAPHLGRRFGRSPWTAREQRPTAREGWADA